ncbi:hypothetical protein [Cryobacterium sp. Y57]|uniref:hypothetical protein n=1 Tax=Cryobacterium sp. Y57 TaxID=2048287 RepID=UPI000CE3FC48|nr:hypothetical protein [Cryobacterium sp. Y57]
MNTREGALDDVLSLWAVQRLATVSMRMRVHTFVALYIVIVAVVTAIAGTAAFLVTSATPVLLGVGAGEVRTVAWSTTFLVIVALAYAEASALLRERFSRVRFTVSAAQVRGLWLALDLPLRHVVLVERGAEHLPRVLVSAALAVGGGTGLATGGHLWPAVTIFLAFGIVLAGALGSHLVALRNATGRPGRRAPTGMWEGYLVLLGLVAGTFAATALRWSGDVAVAGLALGPTWVVPVAVALIGLGWVGVGVLTPQVRRALRSGADVPLLGIDAPALLADRPTLWPRRGRSTVVGAIAVGSGALTVHPMVMLVLRVTLTMVAIGLGVVLSHGPALRGLWLGPLALDEAVLRAAPLGTVMLVSMVCIVPVIAAGHEDKLWHYRTLWELGARPTTVWLAHVTGSLVQTTVLAILVVAGIATLTGEVMVVILAMAWTVVLSEHLSESVLAHASRGDGDRRSVSYAPALLAGALVAPAIFAGIAGGWWALSVFLYVLFLALGGLWCFTHRLTFMPLAPE